MRMFFESELIDYKCNQYVASEIVDYLLVIDTKNKNTFTDDQNFH